MRLTRATSLISATVLVLGLALSWVALAQKAPAQKAPAKAQPPAKAQAQPPAKPAEKPAPPASAPPAGGSTAAGAPLSGDTGADLGNIDEILQGEEEVLSGSGFSYDPGNRRDPFKSLLAGPDRPEIRGPRPEGVPGLLIDEIDLRGIFHTSKGFVAQVVAANQKKSYLLKEGDQLFDGDVVSINKNEVVFKQVVQDPTALKPFREVVKSLNPS
jgi:nucleoid-associated protein YgaU